MGRGHSRSGADAGMSVHPAPASAPSTKSAKGGSVLRPEPGMKPGQLVACSVSLVVAGLLLTRGFIGFNPGRPAVPRARRRPGGQRHGAGSPSTTSRIRTSPERPLEVFAAELEPLPPVRPRPRRAGDRLRRLRAPSGSWAACGRPTGRWRAPRPPVLLPETDWDGVHGFAARIEAQVPSSHDPCGGLPRRRADPRGPGAGHGPDRRHPPPGDGPEAGAALPTTRAVGEG